MSRTGYAEVRAGEHKLILECPMVGAAELPELAETVWRLFKDFYGPEGLDEHSIHVEFRDRPEHRPRDLRPVQ